MDSLRAVGLLLSTAEDAADPIYSTIAGLRATAVALSGPFAGQWRRQMPFPVSIDMRADQPSLRISGRGIFADGMAEALIQVMASTGQVRPYQVAFQDGGRLRAMFIVTQADFVKLVQQDRQFDVTLASAGEVSIL